MKKVVSVIIPVYNVEEFIFRTVESVMNQDYKNIEIILVDDGSLDNSAKIINELAKKDDRITCVHKENGGVLKNTFRSIPELNDKLYYFGADGKAVRGINTINGKKYYFNTRYSYIMTGLCSVNENIYYFNKSNYTMETNTTKIVAGKLKSLSITLTVVPSCNVNNVIELSEANSLTSASCAIFNTPTLFNFSLSLSDKYFFEIYLYKPLYFTL